MSQRLPLSKATLLDRSGRDGNLPRPRCSTLEPAVWQGIDFAKFDGSAEEYTNSVAELTHSEPQGRNETNVVSGYRKLWNHRQHAHGCFGGHERFDRLVLLPTV